jgi:hypothetical protein
MHPLTIQTPTGTLDVNAIESGTNGADASAKSLPIRNLAEALDQVERRVHTTLEQCLMSITTIACQTQRMHAGEVIAKLAEDAYFMRVDKRVTHVPPVRNRQQDNEATSRSADIGRNRTRGELPGQPQPYPGIGRWTLSWWQQHRRRRRRPLDHPSL